MTWQELWLEWGKINPLLNWPLATIIIVFILKSELSSLCDKFKNFSILKLFFSGLGMEIHCPSQENLSNIKTTTIPNDFSQIKEDYSSFAEIYGFSKEQINSSLKFIATEPKKAFSLYLERDLFLNFEFCYRNIYGTQISLLLYLKNLGNSGINESDCESFFSDHCKRANIDRELASIQVYLNFLFNSSLIKKTEHGNIILSAKGIMFLNYIETAIPNFGLKLY